MQHLDQEETVVYRSKRSETIKSFPALEWLAAMCSHIPNRGEQMVKYSTPFTVMSRGGNGRRKAITTSSRHHRTSGGHKDLPSELGVIALKDMLTNALLPSRRSKPKFAS